MAAKKRTALPRHDEVCHFSEWQGRTYDEANRPPSWSNERPLLPAEYVEANPPIMESLPLETFPYIDDFEVRLVIMQDRSGQSPFGYHVEFASPTLGTVARFPWWDHVDADLRRDDFAVPLGTFDEPYYDLEQGWEITIAERGILVYIMEGRFDQRDYDGYNQWFKVLKTRYLEQWDRAITGSKLLAAASGGSA